MVISLLDVEAHYSKFPGWERLCVRHVFLRIQSNLRAVSMGCRCHQVQCCTPPMPTCFQQILKKHQ